jgi:hypothetical protein
MTILSLLQKRTTLSRHMAGLEFLKHLMPRDLGSALCRENASDCGEHVDAAPRSLAVLRAALPRLTEQPP